MVPSLVLASFSGFYAYWLLLLLATVDIGAADIRIVAGWRDSLKIYGPAGEKLQILDRFNCVNADEVDIDHLLGSFEIDFEFKALSGALPYQYFRTMRIIEMELDDLETFWANGSIVTNFDVIHSLQSELSTIILAHRQFVHMLRDESYIYPNDKGDFTSSEQELKTMANAILGIQTVLEGINDSREEIKECFIDQFQHNTDVRSCIEWCMDTKWRVASKLFLRPVEEDTIFKFIQAYAEISLIPFMLQRIQNVRDYSQSNVIANFTVRNAPPEGSGLQPPDSRLLHILFEKPGPRYYTMENVSEEAPEAILVRKQIYSIKPNLDGSHLLTNHQGYGSFSSPMYTCRRRKITTTTDADVTGSSSSLARVQTTTSGDVFQQFGHTVPPSSRQWDCNIDRQEPNTYTSTFVSSVMATLYFEYFPPRRRSPTGTSASSADTVETKRSTALIARSEEGMRRNTQQQQQQQQQPEASLELRLWNLPSSSSQSCSDTPPKTTCVNDQPSTPPPPLTNHVNYQRVLLMGLGSGFTHTWLLQQQFSLQRPAAAESTRSSSPTSTSSSKSSSSSSLSEGAKTDEFQFIVDTVEYSSGVIELATKQFDFEPFYCRFLRYSAETGRLQVLFDSYNKSTVHLDPRTKFAYSADGKHCRSTVILSDAWDYLSAVAGKQTELAMDVADDKAQTIEAMLDGVGTSVPSEQRNLHQSSIIEKAPQYNTQYDVILFDIYDEESTHWPAEVDIGQCNPFIERAISVQSLQNARNLLVPHSGIAVYHIARDMHFKRFVAMLKQVYGASQLVFFRQQQNDYNVVAARDKFIDHEAVNREEGNHYPKSESSSAYNTPRRIPHPCYDPQLNVTTARDSGDMHALNARHKRFADWLLRFTSRHNYGQRVRHSNMFTLECTPH